jgi:hypothetical protein
LLTLVYYLTKQQTQASTVTSHGSLELLTSCETACAETIEAFHGITNHPRLAIISRKKHVDNLVVFVMDEFVMKAGFDWSNCIDGCIVSSEGYSRTLVMSKEPPNILGCGHRTLQFEFL